MSLVEPIMLGTPLIHYNAEYIRSLFGEDYPFLAQSETEAYGWVSAFMDDYEGMYAKFMDWRANSFEPRFKPEGDYGLNLYEHLFQKLLEHKYNLVERWKKEYPHTGEKQFTLEVAKDVDENGYVNLLESVARNDVFGTDLRRQAKGPDSRNMKSLVFAQDWNVTRNAVRAFHGFSTGGPKAGDLRKHEG